MLDVLLQTSSRLTHRWSFLIERGRAGPRRYADDHGPGRRRPVTSEQRAKARRSHNKTILNGLVHGQRRSLLGSGQVSVTQLCRPGELSVGGGAGRVGGLFLAGDQSGDGAQDGIEVVASAEVAGRGPPVGQVAGAMLYADPLRRMGLAFGLVDGGEGGRDRRLIVPPGRARGVSRWGCSVHRRRRAARRRRRSRCGTTPARVRGRAGRDRSAALRDRA